MKIGRIAKFDKLRMPRIDKLLGTAGSSEQNVRRLRARLDALRDRRVHDALELGCGLGAASAFLAREYGLDVCGTDVDAQRVEMARRKHRADDSLRFELEDASRLTYESESFDLVVAQYVFQHIPNWEAAVRETARVTRPGGYVIWLDVAWPKVLHFVLVPLLKDRAMYSLGEIRSAFEDCGFHTRHYARVRQGPIHQHELVLQKEGGAAERAGRAA